MSNKDDNSNREVRSFLCARDPSIDRQFRPRPQKRERLFNEIEEEEDNEYSDYDEDECLSTGMPDSNGNSTEETGALVYLRLRPVENYSPAYAISTEGNVLITGPPTESASSSNNKNLMEKHYSFTDIFDFTVNQREIYEKCIGQKIEAEESLTVLTYGTSGSGKTFTLLGDERRPGIIPRALENIFTIYANNIYNDPSLKLVNGTITILDDDAVMAEHALRQKLFGSQQAEDGGFHAKLQKNIANDHCFEPLALGVDVSVLIWITFVEIYNELVYDLLKPSKSSSISSVAGAALKDKKSLKISGNCGKVFINGVTSVCVKNSLEALKLLRGGLQKVAYASTSINSNSSRSHCIFFVDVLKYYRSGVITETSYKFCDLAGSERLDKTGNIGSRLKEAQRINTSLMVLGRCLDAANKSDRIPYRESKLTTLLQAALQGKEKLTMIVNVTPTEKYYEENLNVLSFASIAKNIIFKAPVNKRNESRYSVFADKQDHSYIQQLLEENACLKIEIQRLIMQHSEEKLKLELDLRNQLVDSFKETLEENKRQSELRLQHELSTQKRLYESRIEFMKRKHEEEIEDLKDEIEECGNDEGNVKEDLE